MKKILITLLIALLFPSLCSAEVINDTIKVMYAENNIKGAFNMLLSIPEEERSAQDWLLMGNIMQDEGKLDEAVFMYNSAIAKNNKDYKAHYNLGNIYLEQNKPNLAISEFKKAIKYNSDFAYGYYNLGCAYLRVNKPRAAKWEFYKAIDINNQIPNFHYNLAYTFKILNNEKQAKAHLDIYNKLIERGQ